MVNAAQPQDNATPVLAPAATTTAPAQMDNQHQPASQPTSIPHAGTPGQERASRLAREAVQLQAEMQERAIQQADWQRRQGQQMGANLMMSRERRQQRRQAN